MFPGSRLQYQISPICLWLVEEAPRRKKESVTEPPSLRTSESSKETETKLSIRTRSADSTVSNFRSLLSIDISQASSDGSLSAGARIGLHPIQGSGSPRKSYEFSSTVASSETFVSVFLSAFTHLISEACPGGLKISPVISLGQATGQTRSIPRLFNLLIQPLFRQMR